MAEHSNLSSGWKSYEVLHKDSEGNPTDTPFSENLARSGTILRQATNKMQLLQSHGWPAAKRSMKDSHGKPLVVPKDELIWLLKCKPHCWRLYFYVEEESKRFIYVHAVCKKKTEENIADARKARNIADKIQRGASAVAPFSFPPG